MKEKEVQSRTKSIQIYINITNSFMSNEVAPISFHSREYKYSRYEIGNGLNIPLFPGYIIWTGQWEGNGEGFPKIS